MSHQLSWQISTGFPHSWFEFVCTSDALPGFRYNTLELLEASHAS